MHEWVSNEQPSAAGGTGGTAACALPAGPVHGLTGLALPPSDAWRRRTQTLLCAALSVLLHGTAVAAILIMVDRPVELGAVAVPSEAISVEIVSSSVLESMQQKETEEAAEAATDSKTGEQTAEPSQAASQAPPAKAAPDKHGDDEAGEIAFADTEMKAAAPLPSRETEHELPKPLTEEPAPVVVPPPPVTKPQSSEDERAEQERARAREAAEEARREARERAEQAERQARERRQREIEEERRQEDARREARRKDEERAERERKKAEHGGTTSRAAAAASGASGRASASAGSILTYAARVRAHVAGHKPSGAGGHGTAVVAFGVTTSGGLSYANVSRSSGSTALDRLAVSAVRSAAPFPQPPAGASPGQLRFTIPFHFQ